MRPSLHDTTASVIQGGILNREISKTPAEKSHSLERLCAPVLNQTQTQSRVSPESPVGRRVLSDRLDHGDEPSRKASGSLNSSSAHVHGRTHVNIPEADKESLCTPGEVTLSEGLPEGDYVDPADVQDIGHGDQPGLGRKFAQPKGTIDDYEFKHNIGGGSFRYLRDKTL